LKFFICELVYGEPQPLDCAAVKWIEKSELTTHEFPAADAQLLEKLKSPRFAWA
jgi:8-oxo-dGTP diphosphatase/A/G-specific adenine glycosylase